MKRSKHYKKREVVEVLPSPIISPCGAVKMPWNNYLNGWAGPGGKVYKDELRAIRAVANIVAFLDSLKPKTPTKTVLKSTIYGRVMRACDLYEWNIK